MTTVCGSGLTATAVMIWFPRLLTATVCALHTRAFKGWNALKVQSISGCSREESWLD